MTKTELIERLSRLPDAEVRLLVRGQYYELHQPLVMPVEAQAGELEVIALTNFELSFGGKSSESAVR